MERRKQEKERQRHHRVIGADLASALRGEGLVDELGRPLRQARFRGYVLTHRLDSDLPRLVRLPELEGLAKMGEAYFGKRARAEDMPALVRLVQAEAEAALFEKEPVKVETVTREIPAMVTRETPETVTTETPETVTRETPEIATTETTETSKPVTEMVEELSTSSSEMEVIESSESEATSSEEEEDVLDLTKEVTSDTDTDMTVDSSL